jgi:hypothetical protein
VSRIFNAKTQSFSLTLGFSRVIIAASIETVVTVLHSPKTVETVISQPALPTPS